MCVWLGGIVTSPWGSRVEKHRCSDISKHHWCWVTHSHFFSWLKAYPAYFSNTLGYSLKMNNMSLLNFDSEPCWVMIVLPLLEYDYIWFFILTILHLLSGTAGEQEMKWGNFIPQETATLGPSSLTIALSSQTSVFTDIQCNWISVRVCNLIGLFHCLLSCSKLLWWMQVKEKVHWNPGSCFPLQNEIKSIRLEE